MPIAIAMLLLGERIRTSVREQSAERLGAALGVLHSQFSADADRLSAKLALLAADAELKRSYLVDSPRGAGLRDHLAGKLLPSW